MKFGKQIQSQQLTEWSSHYLDYKGLKKFISKLLNEPRANTSMVSAPNVEDDRCKLLHSQKAAFFFKLERELEKINSFYLQKENELKVRLRTLMDKKKMLQSDGRRPSHASSVLNALEEAFVQLERELTKLQKYVDLNNEGFRKILKKWDKRSKSTTKELYLSRQIDIQPCFNIQFLRELSELAANNHMELSKLQDGIPLSPPSSKAAHPSTPATMADLVADDMELELVKAVSSGQESLVREALERIEQNPSPDDRDRLSRVFWHACAEAPSRGVIDLLIRTGKIDFQFVDDINERSCLHMAAMAGRCDILEICAEHGNVPTRDGYGQTALHYATMKGYSDCVAFLLTHNADIEARDHNGFSPLIYAIMNGHTACVEMLLGAGANFEPTHENDHVPLSLACYYGHTDIAKMLFERGAKSLPNNESLYPLHLAARQGHVELCRLLAQRNSSDLDLRDKYYSWTPLFWAASDGHATCVRILIDAGCQVSLKDENDKTALYYAAWEGQMECMQLLIDAGCEVETIQDETSPVQVQEEESGDMEFDTIPSLSLPPPIIPFRIYGHSYLDRKYQIHIVLNQSSIRLYDNPQISSLKLIISSKPDLGMIPHNVILPLSEDRDMFTFQVDNLDTFFLEFDIVGSRLLCRGVSLPEAFSSSDIKVEDGHRTIPLLDSHLKVVGELAYDYAVVKPFRGVQLEIGGRIETYWKSTNTVPPAVSSSASSPSHTTPDLSSPANSILPPPSKLPSFITASSLSGEYIHVVVQLTRDGVPVVFANWLVSSHHLDLAVSDLTFEQFCQLGESLLKEHQEPQGGLCSVTGNSMVLQQLGEGRSFLSLQQVLQRLPPSMGVHLELKYPSVYEATLHAFSNIAGRNTFVDAILKCIYDHVRSLPPDAVNTSIFFSSSNPAICTTVNWKQPNYAVFFITYCGINKKDEWQRGIKRRLDNIDADNLPKQDSRCVSLKEAVKFAKRNNLLGIISEAKLLVQVPSLIQNVKESGLILVTFGEFNADSQSRRMQERHGVDAIMVDEKVHFNTTMAGAGF